MNKVELTTDGTLMWFCPGCGQPHGVPVVGGRRWGWNDSLTVPTLTPSVLVHGHETMAPFLPQPRCHSFVKEGKLQFLPDCGHFLAGNTVDMVDWEGWQVTP